MPNVLPIPAARHLGTLQHMPVARPPNWAEVDRSDKPRWVRALDASDFALGVTDQVRRRAYEALLSVDEQLGLLLEQLERLGIDDETAIVLTSDNGVVWGEHGLTWQGKGCPYEECLRVPMVVRYPRAVTAAGHLVDTPVLNIDVAPTLADLAGISLPTAVDGVSFAAALSGGTSPLRHDFLLEHWNWKRDGYLALPTVQPNDGDRLRVFFGPWPKTSLAFEFVSDDILSTGALPVPMQATAQDSFRALGIAVTSLLPDTDWDLQSNWILVRDTSPASDGICLLDEVNTAGSLYPLWLTQDFFGVRDLANNFTYVEHACGEVELYDLSADPWQLENCADDPGYAGARARLRGRLRELLALHP
jgi:arylsulfatase A-like enzyme